MSHLIQDRSRFGGFHQFDCGRSNKQIRAHYPFFVKPYIHFGELRHEPINNAILTSFGDTLTFSANVWVVKIKNKKYGRFTRNAFNCGLEITQFKNGADVGETVHVAWDGNELPTNCRYPSSLPNLEDYKAKIPFCYIRELIHEITNPTILAGGERDIILACTFNEFHSVYIVSQKSMGEQDVISIPFNELNKHEFLMKFYSGKYNKSEKFRLRATSWNDVSLTWV